MKSIDFNLKLSPRKSYFMPLDCRFKYLTTPATVKSEDEKKQNNRGDNLCSNKRKSNLSSLD